MAHRKIKSNFNILSNYDFFTPGPVDIIILLFLLLGGALIGGLISMPFVLLMPDNPDSMMYSMIVSYPVMTYLWGRHDLTWFFYVPSFTCGTLIGGSIAAIVLYRLQAVGVLKRMQMKIEGGEKVWKKKPETKTKQI